MTLPDPDNRGRFPRWFALLKALQGCARTVLSTPRRAARDAYWIYRVWRQPIV